MSYKNYYPIKKFSFFYQYLCIIDSKDHLAAEVFQKHGVKVLFLKQYGRMDEDYVFVFVKVRKKDILKFFDALEALKTEMKKSGHSDYPDVCKRFYCEVVGVNNE